MIEMYAYSCALLLFSLGISANGHLDSRLLIKTNSGLVRGKIVTGYTQKEARAFYGIRYAEPPVGELRFKPPVPVAPWNDVFDATQNPLPCYQQYTKHSLSLSKRLGTTIRRPWSEDCLTLNIWTPTDEELVDAPVLIVFHGENFMTGTGSYPFVDFSTFSVEANLIQISINYRLGALGFLSLGTPDFPGNLGLMDQHLALKWIHTNIDKFGGKTSAKFLYGIDEGAASVGHQIILEENAGLFVFASLIDGSPTCPNAWQTKNKTVEISKLLSQDLGCNRLNITEEIQCLQKVHPEEIVDAIAFGDDTRRENFKPNIDGTFIKEPPLEALKAGKVNNVTVLVTLSAKAGSLKFLDLNDDILVQPGPELTSEGFKEAIKRLDISGNEVERQIIHDWYLKEECIQNSTDIRDLAIEVYTESLFTCCSYEFLMYATKSDLQTHLLVFGVPDPKFPAWIGAHSEILLSVLKGEPLDLRHGYDEIVRSSSMGTVDAIRIYFRKPMDEFHELIPLFSLEDRQYMLRKEKLFYTKDYQKDNCLLWNEILPEIRSRHGICSTEEELYRPRKYKNSVN